jgi:hypothetical protein
MSDLAIALLIWQATHRNFDVPEFHIVPAVYMNHIPDVTKMVLLLPDTTPVAVPIVAEPVRTPEEEQAYRQDLRNNDYIDDGIGKMQKDPEYMVGGKYGGQY